MFLEHLLEFQALPDKLQIKHFTQSLSRAPGVGRNVPTLDQWNEMSPCTQLDDTSHFPSATCCIQRGAFLTLLSPHSHMPDESSNKRCALALCFPMSFPLTHLHTSPAHISTSEM